jgi:hypothetical protein
MSGIIITIVGIGAAFIFLGLGALVWVFVITVIRELIHDITTK